MPEASLEIIVLNFFAVIALGMLLTTFVHQTLTQKRSTPHLLTAIIFANIGELLYLCSLFNLFELAEKLESLSNIAFVIFYYYIYVHAEALMTTEPPLWRYGLVGGIASASVVMFLLNIMDLLTGKIAFPLTIFMSFVVGLIVFGFSAIIMYKIYQLVKESGPLWDLIAILCIFCAMIAYIINAIYLLINSGNVLFLEIGDFILISGIVIYMINYIIHDYILQIPFPIHEVVLYNANGVRTYSRRVFGPHNPVFRLDEEIMTGMF